MFCGEPVQGKLTGMFKFTLNVEYVMGYHEGNENMPLYYASVSEHYGCVFDTADGAVIYTGDLGREWNRDINDYEVTYAGFSADGVLQNLGSQTILEWLGR